MKFATIFAAFIVIQLLGSAKSLPIFGVHSIAQAISRAFYSVVILFKDMPVEEKNIESFRRPPKLPSKDSSIEKITSETNKGEKKKRWRT